MTKNPGKLSSTCYRFADDKLIFYYQNTNGLRTKTSQFKGEVSINNFKIYVFTETGLHEMMFDNELFTNDYVIYRCDRIIGLTSDKTQKVGVLIAVHVTIQSSLILKFNDFGIEQLLIKIITCGRNVYIGALYIPPHSKIDLYKEHISTALSIIEEINDNDLCLLTGDFYLPDIIWCQYEDKDSDISFLLPVNIKSEIEMCVIDQLMSEGLCQVNHIMNSNMK